MDHEEAHSVQNNELLQLHVLAPVRVEPEGEGLWLTVVFAQVTENEEQFPANEIAASL